MNDFRADPSALLDAQDAAAARVLRSGWFVLGDEVRRFEAAWSTACGGAHAVGVANGLDAIEIGLRALGLQPGDEIVTTPMTAYATVLGIQRAGGVPVLADIDPGTALLDPASVERCIGPRTRGVLLVHLYGQVRAMPRWQALCAHHGLWLLEDCAQSHLAASGGVVAGGFGRFGAYSFYPTKNLGAPGDAGALVTREPDVAERARMLRNYGQVTRYEHREAGMNSRLDELQAALLSERLVWLERFTARRRAIVDRYRAGLADTAVACPLLPPESPESHVHHLFVVVSARRDALSAHLREQGVETIIHYPIAAHRQPAADPAWRRDPAGLAHAEAHAATCLSLPCHPNLSDADVDRVIEAVHAFR
jgi:dTDP-4-amino-4,6-dideoxygalactose transaminase